jgi:NADPH:quinone reductase-like Zn-dependent oxidoreductase
MLTGEKQKKEDIIKRKRPGSTMNAVRIHNYGDSAVLSYEEAPIPEILPDEVLIKVCAAAVNPVDWKIREGYMKDHLPHTFPLTLGWDVSGTVEKTGSLIGLFKKGDTVIARPDTSRNGTYAEFVAVRGYELAVAPANMPLAHAAAIPLASQTAWSGLFEQGNLDKNQKVLIHGASGGVGTFAVQFAKCAGAYVIATASTKNISLVKSLGADEVIDYTKEDFSEKVKDADMVFDTIGKETQQKSWQVLRKGGILVSTVGTDEQQAKKHGVRTKSFMMISNGARLQAIAELIDKNIVHVIIDKEFPLDEAKAAQDHVKEGHAQGKTILKVSDNSIQF